MNKKRRIEIICEVLDEHIKEPPIPLQHKDPFTLLVAVVLSARCTDARVNQVTPKLFELADRAHDFAKLDPLEVEKIIKPCGLSPAKSRNLVAMSKILVDQFDGEVPNTFEALEMLPGVGHKTASVVMTQAFHIPAFPVDTHIARAANRWGLSKGKNVEVIERDLKKCFKKSEWGKRHLQIILYCRSFCPARGHDVSFCPICKELASVSNRTI